MTLKINVKIDYKEAEVVGYGLIKVRPLGAGEQLELNQLQRELEELKFESCVEIWYYRAIVAGLLVDFGLLEVATPVVV